MWSRGESKMLNAPADRLVRAKYNRKLSAEERLWDSVDKQDVMSRISFIKPRKKGEKSRQVQQEIKVLRCTFPVKGKEGIEKSLNHGHDYCLASDVSYALRPRLS